MHLISKQHMHDASITTKIFSVNTGNFLKIKMISLPRENNLAKLLRTCSFLSFVVIILNIFLRKINKLTCHKRCWKPQNAEMQEPKILSLVLR